MKVFAIIGVPPRGTLLTLPLRPWGGTTCGVPQFKARAVFRRWLNGATSCDLFANPRISAPSGGRGSGRLAREGQKNGNTRLSVRRGRLWRVVHYGCAAGGFPRVASAALGLSACGETLDAEASGGRAPGGAAAFRARRFSANGRPTGKTTRYRDRERGRHLRQMDRDRADLARRHDLCDRRPRLRIRDGDGICARQRLQ